MISTPGQAQTEAAKAPAPTLHSSSQVSDAPGKGILPMIRGHMAAGLSLYHLDAQPIEQVSPLIQRQYLHGSLSTFSKWIMKKGAVVPLRHHANEQITWITQGEAEVASLAALTLGAITGHNNIFRDGERHGYSESAIGDDARTMRARMPSFKKT